MCDQVKPVEHAFVWVIEPNEFAGFTQELMLQLIEQFVAELPSPFKAKMLLSPWQPNKSISFQAVAANH